MEVYGDEISFPVTFVVRAELKVTIINNKQSFFTTVSACTLNLYGLLVLPLFLYKTFFM